MPHSSNALIIFPPGRTLPTQCRHEQAHGDHILSGVVKEVGSTLAGRYRRGDRTAFVSTNLYRSDTRPTHTEP